MKRTLERDSTAKRCYLGTEVLPEDLLILICAHLTLLEVQALCRALCGVWQFDVVSTVRRYRALQASPTPPTMAKYTDPVIRLMRGFIGPTPLVAVVSDEVVTLCNTSASADGGDRLIEFLCAQKCYYCTDALASASVPLIERHSRSQLALCTACSAKLWKNRMTQKEVNVDVGRWKGCVYRMHVPYHKQASRVVERVRDSIGYIDDSVLDALLMNAGYLATRDTFVHRHCIRRLAEPPGKDTRNLYLLSDVKTALASLVTSSSSSSPQPVKQLFRDTCDRGPILLI